MRHIIDSSPTHRQHDAHKLQYTSTRTSAERSKKYAKMMREDELRSMGVIKEDDKITTLRKTDMVEFFQREKELLKRDVVIEAGLQCDKYKEEFVKYVMSVYDGDVPIQREQQ